MKLKFMDLQRVIEVTAGVTAVYLLSIMLEFPWQCSIFLFGLALIANVWMVIRILKDPWSTDKTFDDYFYQDREDLKRTGKD